MACPRAILGRMPMSYLVAIFLVPTHVSSLANQLSEKPTGPRWINLDYADALRSVIYRYAFGNFITHGRCGSIIYATFFEAALIIGEEHECEIRYYMVPRIFIISHVGSGSGSNYRILRCWIRKFAGQRFRRKLFYRLRSPFK